MDTGQCIPESLATLQAQQAQLIAGRRDAQMFPIGTAELPLPAGLDRHRGRRGIFHFWPDRVSSTQIDVLSAAGRENVLLLLGPYSKPEIAERVRAGEQPRCVVEYLPDGTELRAAVGTDVTIPEQIDYFEVTKDDPANTVGVTDLIAVIKRRMEQNGAA